MDTAGIKVLTFDCYGTLIDWEAGILAVLRPWANRHGLGVSDDQLLESHAAAEAKWEALAPSARYTDILGIVLMEIARGCGAPALKADAELMSASIGNWPAFEDSPAALAKLAERFKLVVLSNIDADAFTLSQAKLGVAFDAVVTAEDVQSYKPNLAHFERGLEIINAWGISNGEVLHVAQSLYHDHVPAKQLGLATAWINRRHNKPGWGATPAPTENVQPDITVASMAELAETLL